MCALHAANERRTLLLVQSDEALRVELETMIADLNSRAADLLGVTRPTLYDLPQKYRIDAAQFARGAAMTVCGARGF